MMVNLLMTKKKEKGNKMIINMGKENYIIKMAIFIMKVNLLMAKKEGNGQYMFENGCYYIGQWLNDKMHGNGIIFYKNGKINYEGEFANDKKEGNGKYIEENGDYYIGQWLNDNKHGKGKEYYTNGEIKHEGQFINGKYFDRCVFF